MGVSLATFRVWDAKAHSFEERLPRSDADRTPHDLPGSSRLGSSFGHTQTRSSFSTLYMI